MFIPSIVLLIIITEGFLIMYKICTRVSDYRSGRYYYKGLKLKIKHQKDIYNRVIQKVEKLRQYAPSVKNGHRNLDIHIK